LLADLIYALWEAVVEPRWQQLQDLLERDVLYRSRLLARGGLTALFSDLEPLITLRERTLFVNLRTEGNRIAGGGGLRLMPSAFLWPTLSSSRGSQQTLIYPSRGAGLLFWTEHGAGETMGKLIGSTRAVILEQVGEGSHTSALARSLGTSSISHPR
jgi:hypothetical protein